MAVVTNVSATVDVYYAAMWCMYVVFITGTLRELSDVLCFCFVFFRSRVRLSWATHYVGDLR